MFIASLKINLHDERGKKPLSIVLARWTGLEPATSRVTGECSNQIELPPQLFNLTTSYSGQTQNLRRCHRNTVLYCIQKVGVWQMKRPYIQESNATPVI